MLATALLVGHASRSESVPPSRPLSEFPIRIDSWVGESERFDDNVYRILGVDDSILATYRSPGGEWVQLYVGFYASQREGDLIHSPKNCMPGGGWNIVRMDLETLDVPSLGKPFEAIKLVLEKGDRRQVVLYWFQSRGRFIASEYLQKIYLVFDSITRNRTDGSFVRLIAPVGPGGEDLTLETMKSFAAQLVPVLMTYLPS
ncbi:MAG: EpsI family protein [Deltaproteobacteria bacterium]|nr:EpsI family protein [Deltaproteobacteria bacterium]